MSPEPIALPIRRALDATAFRKLAVRYADWADTARRSAEYWRSVDDAAEAASYAAGQAKAYAACATEARHYANLLSPQEKPDAEPM